MWLPGDGKANPADLTLALAKGARNRGAKVFESVRVTAIEHARVTARKRVTELTLAEQAGDEGRIDADIVVICAGQWARAIGRRATSPCRCFRASTSTSSPTHRRRASRPAGDARPRRLHLLQGGSRRTGDGWLRARRDAVVQSASASRRHPGELRVPAAARQLGRVPDPDRQCADPRAGAGDRRVKQFFNGPESFTADNNFILGAAPGFENFFVGCGFNSMGIASAGGAGKALAEWIVQGEPTMDLWPVDIRRFARFNGNEHWLPDRIGEVLGMHYKMPWPNRELESARPFRRSPLYALLQRRRRLLRFQDGLGARRTSLRRHAAGADRILVGPAELASRGAPTEHRACRERVALFDMSSFAKLLIKGRGRAKRVALDHRQRRAARPGETSTRGC